MSEEDEPPSVAQPMEVDRADLCILATSEASGKMEPPAANDLLYPRYAISFLSLTSMFAGADSPRCETETLAANLATSFPSTSPRPNANSAKKRRCVPNLSRPIASPNHSTKMSMIFKDAASMMQGARSPPLQQSPISPNMKRARLPLSQARITKFGTSGDIGTRDASTSNTPCKGGEELPSQSRLLATPALTSLSDLHREPISSGFATPSAPCGKQGNYRSMDLGALEYAQSSSAVSAFGSGGDDYSGVPLPIACSDAQVEKTKHASVDAWLNDLLEATEDRLALMPGQATEDETRPSQHASASSLPKSSKNKACQSSPTADKENIPPAGSSSPRIQTPRHYTQASTPSRFRGPNIQSPAVQHFPYPIKSPIRFPHPLTPNGHLSQPPIRKKARLNIKGTNMWDTPPQKEQRSTQDFTIHEDAMASALAKLSPSVERHRKGRRPKRERCISYWDTDILNPDSPGFPAATGCEAKQDRDEGEQTHVRKGKAVLGECADSEALTREPPFIKGADGKKFDFEYGSRPLPDCEMQE